MPSLGVNTAIIQDGKILLTRRTDFNVWCLPGGSLEPDESLAEASQRETLEEVGLEVHLTGLVGLYSRPGWIDGGLHIVVFSAKVVRGELKLQVSEVAEARFFPRVELPQDEYFLHGHRRRALDALDGVRGAVWFQDAEWPHPANITRQRLYQLCAESGLPSDEYYRRYVGKSGPRGDVLEVK